MNLSKREEIILKILEKKGFVTVKDLSKATYTSESSIRRDLTSLEKQLLIKRIHGGAVHINSINNVFPFDSRKHKNSAEKKSAAKKASRLLCDSQSVMLDGSSAALYMLPYIKKHMNMRVFTNNIYTFQTSVKMGIDTSLIGGKASGDNNVLTGEISEKITESLFPDILFFSSHCLNENGDITDPTECENHLRSIMIKNAKVRVFLYDNEKTDRTALYKLCNIDDIEYSFGE